MTDHSIISDLRTKDRWLVNFPDHAGGLFTIGGACPDFPPGLYRALPENGRFNVSALVAVRAGKILDVFVVPAENRELHQKALEERFGMSVVDDKAEPAALAGISAMGLPRVPNRDASVADAEFSYALKAAEHRDPHAPMSSYDPATETPHRTLPDYDAVEVVKENGDPRTPRTINDEPSE